MLLGTSFHWYFIRVNLGHCLVRWSIFYRLCTKYIMVPIFIQQQMLMKVVHLAIVFILFCFMKFFTWRFLSWSCTWHCLLGNITFRDACAVCLCLSWCLTLRENVKNTNSCSYQFKKKNLSTWHLCDHPLIKAEYFWCLISCLTWTDVGFPIEINGL